MVSVSDAQASEEHVLASEGPVPGALQMAEGGLCSAGMSGDGAGNFRLRGNVPASVLCPGLRVEHAGGDGDHVASVRGDEHGELGGAFNRGGRLGPVHSLVGLRLAPDHRRGHNANHDRVNAVSGCRAAARGAGEAAAAAKGRRADRGWRATPPWLCSGIPAFSQWLLRNMSVRGRTLNVAGPYPPAATATRPPSMRIVPGSGRYRRSG